MHFEKQTFKNETQALTTCLSAVLINWQIFSIILCRFGKPRAAEKLYVADARHQMVAVIIFGVPCNPVSNIAVK